MLKIKFIGNVKIEKDSLDLTEKLAGKAIALISLLFMSEKQVLNRVKIIEHLWPDSSEDAGKNNLRYNLWEIKNLIGEDKDGNSFILSNRMTCSINQDYDYYCDFVELNKISRGVYLPIGDWEKLDSYFQGDFLEGYYFKECETLNNMIIFERQRMEDQRIKILFYLLDYYTNNNMEDSIMRTLRELEKVGPYDEVVAQKILENYEKMGRRSLGILFYRNFRNRLTTFFGIQPSENLKKTFERLKAQEEQQEKVETVSKEINRRKEKITIETNCIGNIKYFWISEFLEKMSLHPYLSNKVEEIKNEKRELLFLDIHKDYCEVEKPPDMRLAKSFLYLMRELARECSLVIIINEMEKMDDFSKMIFEQIQGNKNIEVIKNG